MERDTFICYKSFIDAAMQLNNEDRLKYYDRLVKYAIYWIDEKTTGLSETLFILVRPNLDSNNKKYKDWCKWWRPKKTTGYKNKKPKEEEEEEVEEEVEVDDNKKKEKKILFLNKVFLTEKEYSSLVVDFWEKDIENRIEDLNEYIINKCKGKDPYSDHNLTIRKRLKKDWVKKKEHIEPHITAETDEFFTSFQKEIWNLKT